MNRRHFLASGAALGLVGTMAEANESYQLAQKFHPQSVNINIDAPAGQIHVNSENHFLYWTLGEGKAIRYGVAVGEPGRQFRGAAVIRRKAEWPSWVPTPEMIRLEPQVYGRFPNGLPGGHPWNPLGARALYMYDAQGRDTLFRVHGTVEPWRIGESYSSGCIRLANEHIEDLYARVPLGTVIYVS